MAKRRIPWMVKCGGKRTNGEPCKKWANYGGVKCRLHGGNTPQARRKAQERIELASRATIQPAIDALFERLTTGPRHKRLAVALAVLTEAGIMSQESADMIDPMKDDELVGEKK